MAIGIGVLNKFNGNDPSTLIALGTLDSFSAGVLLWTGLIEMWSHDWLRPLEKQFFCKTTVALVSLILGMLLMSLLGSGRKFPYTYTLLQNILIYAAVNYQLIGLKFGDQCL